MLNRFKKILRKSQTDAESILWHHLRNRNFQKHKFRRQYVLCGYIVDFVCLEERLVIELDGGQHAKRAEYDSARTLKLEADGFQVLRFWNDEIFNNLDGVLETIYQILKTPLTRRAKNARRPLPQGER